MATSNSRPMAKSDFLSNTISSKTIIKADDLMKSDIDYDGDQLTITDVRPYASSTHDKLAINSYGEIDFTPEKYAEPVLTAE